MERLERFIKKMLEHRKLVLILFIGASVLSLYLSTKVSINYNMIDYLPEKAPSTIAIDVMDESYEKAVPNLRVLVPNVSIPEALQYKDKLEQVAGVSDINWLDDIVNIHIPLEIQDEETIADWYVDGNALFSIVLEEDGQAESLDEIRAIIGDQGAVSGNPVDTVNTQVSTGSEISRMMLYIIPIMLIILLLTTTAWVDPFLFLINVGVAIALNMGTNLIFGEISFITNATAMILQLACSMDYAIFLLDRFAETRQEISNPVDAMARAVMDSVTSVLSSGLTTIVGFLALAIMQFRIGADMGVVLAKGIIFSLLSTLLFMPSLAVSTYKLIDKTTHRSLLPSFKKLGKWASKYKVVVVVVVAILLVPSYKAQKRIHFLYGVDGMAGPDSQITHDKQRINGIFGESASFALLVPKGSLATEQELGQKIKDLPETASLLSYVETVGNTIPESMLPEEALNMLNSQDYTRLVISARIPPESEETFAYVETLRGLAQEAYGDTYHLAGEVVNVYDMRETIQEDSVKVNLVSIGAIAIILLFTFRSLSLPVLLLLTIESSIFLNTAIPYFIGQHLNYIGFLIISSVQLGATVDYAILFANSYLGNRETMLKKEAAAATISDTAGSILTSGGILTAAGLVLGVVSTNTVISQLGILVARGAVLSAILVLVLLPALLGWCDGIIQKTTLKLNFRQPDKKSHKNNMKKVVEAPKKEEKPAPSKKKEEKKKKQKQKKQSKSTQRKEMPSV